MVDHEEIERLRDARGAETVTFGDIADHLTDFVRRDPDQADAVARLAVFLTTVERVQHVHRDEAEGSGLSDPEVGGSESSTTG